MLKLCNVSKIIDDKKILKNIELDIKSGERIVIIGPSGSGKSTLLRCINMISAPSSGEIYFKNVKLDNNNICEYREKIGMVFQNFNLFNNLTVMENITLAPVKLGRMSMKDAVKEGKLLLKKIDLLDKCDVYPSSLSGGQKQRVAIVRALMMKPEIMLFDEPTSALDPEMVNEVQNLMLELANENMTMVIVTHEISFVRKVATKILFMDGGKIISSGSYDELKNSDNETVKLFLSNID